MMYASVSNGWAERLVCTIKGATSKLVHRKPSGWDLAVPRVFYDYWGQGLVSGFMLV